MAPVLRSGEDEVGVWHGDGVVTVPSSRLILRTSSRLILRESEPEKNRELVGVEGRENEGEAGVEVPLGEDKELVAAAERPPLTSIARGSDGLEVKGKS